MPDMDLSVEDARKIALQAQGLLRAAPFGRGVDAAARAIDQLGYVQIDTISVVNRAHHHVMQSRVPGFEPELYNKLLGRKTIFEYWFHAAAYLPLREYRYYLRAMRAAKARWKVDRKTKREVLAAIRAEGPLGSRFFESGGHQSGGWWDWKPAKRALELLYLQGELLVTAREGFQKVYDLADRALPADLDTSRPSDDEWGEFLVRRVVRAQGLATRRDIAYLKQGARHLYPEDINGPLDRALATLCESGELLTVSVAGDTWYTNQASVDALPLRASKRLVRFLSPFDNAVINRRRTQSLFGLDYTLECYVPEAKRKFGYFCLPMLLGAELIGRMDAKADRKKKVLIVRNLVLENGADPDRVTDPLTRGLREFAESVGCDSLTFDMLPDELGHLSSGF